MKYLKIEVTRGGNAVNRSYYLLSDNIAAFIYEISAKELRIYFKNANPFAFLRLFMNDVEFKAMYNLKGVTTAEREGSVFIYSCVETAE